MRRVNGLASLRSIVTAAANGGISSASTQHRLIPPAANFHSLRQITNPSASRGVSGAVLFSTAAAAASTTLTQESHAKAPPNFAPKEVTLYQYEACPFCNKVKAFLDYNKIPYKVVEVNPISKKEIKWSEYKKVPILTVDGEQMVNSSDIIKQMYQKLQGEDTVPLSEEEKEWLGWVDDHLVHVLSPNIYRSASEALESFDYITTNGNFSFTERLVAKYSGAAAMYFVSKKLKKKYNITDERKALYDAAEAWVDALKGREYLGGSQPNLADLAVYGVLRPIRYLRSGKDMVENTHIGDWYARMEGIIGKSARIN
ncbi:hypothetical protein ACFE04_008955 [Oxalis oulophora]